MLPEMGPPETTIWEYPGPDRSWEDEWTEFVTDIRLGRAPSVGLEDARAALEIVGSIYAGAGRLEPRTALTDTASVPASPT
jgi:hypothetical protein